MIDQNSVIYKFVKQASLSDNLFLALKAKQVLPKLNQKKKPAQDIASDMFNKVMPELKNAGSTADKTKPTQVPSTTNAFNIGSTSVKAGSLLDQFLAKKRKNKN